MDCENSISIALACVRASSQFRIPPSSPRGAPLHVHPAASPSPYLSPSVLVGCNATPSPAPAADNRSAAAQPDTSSAAPDQSPNESHRSRSRHAHSSASAEPGDFDFYLLNLSWSPEFCATHPTSPECASHLGFVVHGLWPQNTDGSCIPSTALTRPAPPTHRNTPTCNPPSAWSSMEVDHPRHLLRPCRRRLLRRHPPRLSVRSTSPPPSPPALLTRDAPPDAILTQFSAANPTFPAASLRPQLRQQLPHRHRGLLRHILHAEACASPSLLPAPTPSKSPHARRSPPVFLRPSGKHQAKPNTPSRSDRRPVQGCPSGRDMPLVKSSTKPLAPAAWS